MNYLLSYKLNKTILECVKYLVLKLEKTPEFGLPVTTKPNKQ